ncbi:hypothetical protein F443_19245 [Phytophthora nicotianae P1569]|uniref:Uncharacterized protein n=1 Tax=Phytophthora nicotianae P1569 TaxID=1317065 RepID=V9E540_PHYNI|nr:hypothetical protein F443_19245 [Phytophthora nicotianae P1569]
MQTTSSSASSTDPPAYFVMEEDLKPWELHSLDGAEGPETLDTMKSFFARYRAICGKATNVAYTHDALQRVVLFHPTLERRATRRPEHVCQLVQREWRICYVHLVEGCANCSETRDRPTPTEWEHQLELWPLSEVERQAIGRYDGRCLG